MKRGSGRIRSGRPRSSLARNRVGEKVRQEGGGGGGGGGRGDGGEESEEKVGWGFHLEKIGGGEAADVPMHQGWEKGRRRKSGKGRGTPSTGRGGR